MEALAVEKAKRSLEVSPRGFLGTHLGLSTKVGGKYDQMLSRSVGVL